MSTLASKTLPLLLLAACQCGPGPHPLDDTAGLGPGVDPTVPAEPGESRAGLVTEDTTAALFGGITAEGRPGDIKLYNSEVQLIIQGAREGHGMISAGGQIIDADLVRRDGVLHRDTVEDLFLAFGFSRVFDASSVVILDDGSAGGSAVVEAVGTDVPWGFIQGLFEYEEPVVPELLLDIRTTFELPPDSHVVTVRSELTNTGEQTAAFTPQAGAIVSNEDQRAWADGPGLEGPGTGALALQAFTGRRGEATIGSWSTADDLNVSVLAELTSGLGIFLVDHPRVELEPGETVVIERRVAVARDVAQAQAARWEDLALELGTVTGLVSDRTGPVAGARVHLLDDEDLVRSVALTDSEGAWEARLPPGDWTAWVVAREDGEHVELPEGAGRYGPFTSPLAQQEVLQALSGGATPLPWARGRIGPAPQDFSLAAGETLSLESDLPEASGLIVQISDTGGAPLPAVVEVRFADGPPENLVPEELAKALGVPTSSRATWAWTSTGELRLDLPPGLYTASAGHSWRHSQDQVEDIVISDGSYTTVSLELAELVTRDGWLSLDPHLHGSPSMDGALPMEDRLIACAAAGVDLPVLTDHDALADYRPLAAALGLEPAMQAVPGTELTTLVRGHFNLFPLEPDPDAVNGGALSWWTELGTTQELFDRMQAAAGTEALVQVNHPRTPGMFAFGGYTPETGTPSKPDFWSWDWELFELLNGGVTELEAVRLDWFSFLDYGLPVTPTGASDSHYRYIPCGLAHTDVYLGTDEPGTVSFEDLREALLAGHVVVASGTTLRASLTGDSGEAALPGDTVTGSSFQLKTWVAAPDWVEPGTLVVTLGSPEGLTTVLEQELTEADADGVWLDESWDLDVSADSWLVVEVQGTAPMGDLWRNAAPYAAANAFLIDVDGDGWTAPRSWGD